MGSMKRGSLYRGIEVIFHIFYHYWGKENRSLHRGLRYKKVRYIEVLLHVMVKLSPPKFTLPTD